MNEKEALKFALEGLEKWGWGDDPRGAKKYIIAIEEVLTLPEERYTYGTPLLDAMTKEYK